MTGWIVTNAYVSDKDGNPVLEMGRYAVLEMKIPPNDSLSAALNYDWRGTGFNDGSIVNILLHVKKTFIPAQELFQVLLLIHLQGGQEYS